MNPFSYPPSSLLYPPTFFPPPSSHPIIYPPPPSSNPPPSSSSSLLSPQSPTSLLHYPSEGNIDLIDAVRSGKKDLVIYLLEIGVPVDFKTANGKNALFYAIERKDKEMIELLIRKGAKITNLPQDGNFEQETLRFINEISIEMKVLGIKGEGTDGRDSYIYFDCNC